jgi:ABC-type branched-subunit amino acid transport system ATPase component/ABC-type branched-subunit amino acid transport system permease subunit
MTATTEAVPVAEDGPVHTTTRPVLAAMRSPGSQVLTVVLLGWILIWPDYMIYTLSAAIPVAFAGLGLLVLQGWSREISLASAGLFATSLYYYGWFARPTDGLGLPWVIAAVLAIGIATGLMAVVAGMSVKLPGIYLVVLTLGLQIVIEKAIFTQGKLSGGLSGGNLGAVLTTPRPWFFGLDLAGDTAFYLFSLAWLGLTLAALVRLRHSPTGLAFLLVGADRQAAAAVGIPPARFRMLAFVTSGLLAGMGGVLACWLFITPPVFLGYGFDKSLLLLSIPVVAGLDSIGWVLVVVATLQVIPVAFESARIDTYLLAGTGLVAGVLLGSGGIGGRAKDLTRRLKHGDRVTRTRRTRVDTEVQRVGTGLADDEAGNLTPDQRRDCLATLEEWLPPRPTEEYAVRAEDVHVAFRAIRALNGASIAVPTGAMVGLIGPNGAGKSTLFDVINGFTAADAGRVELFGTDVTEAKAWNRAKLGMARTFQSTRVIADLSVADNLLAGAYQQIRPGALSFILGRRVAWQRLRRAEATAFAAARLLDIDRYWDERVGTLEFSARRRVEIGRALLAGPRLLLLDEPAAGLDPASSTALFTLIRRLHQDLGLTVLLVEHYVKAVLENCDLVYVLAQGAILAQGTPAEVAADPEVRDRYLGTRLRYLDAEDPDGNGSGADGTGADGNGPGPEASAKPAYAPIVYPPLRRD